MSFAVRWCYCVVPTFYGAPISDITFFHLFLILFLNRSKHKMVKQCQLHFCSKLWRCGWTFKGRIDFFRNTHRLLLPMRLAKHHWSQEIVTFWCTIGTGGWFGCAKRTYILDGEEQELICYVDRVVPLYMCVCIYLLCCISKCTSNTCSREMFKYVLKAQGHHSSLWLWCDDLNWLQC